MLCASQITDRCEEFKKHIESFDEIIEKSLNDMNVPGAAISVYADGEIILQKGYGYRDADNRLPVTTETLFPIGSITKSITALTLLTLVDQGVIDIDDKIVDLNPNFRLGDGNLTYEMTLRDYLTHMSGFPRHDGVWFGEKLSRDDLVKKLRFLKPAIPYRSGFIYQNIGYAIIGNALEHITNKSWEDLVRERIFTPVGMDACVFDLQDMINYGNYATGYVSIGNKGISAVQNIDPTTIGPAGSIKANLEDMSKLLKAFVNKCPGLMQETTWKEMVTPKVISKLVCCEEYGVDEYVTMEAYGPGMIIISYRNHLCAFHGGNIDGFSSIFMSFPKDNLGLVILTNKQDSPLPYLFSAMIMDKLLQLPEVDWLKKYHDIAEKYTSVIQVGEVSDNDSNSKPTHPISEYAGEYEEPAYGELIVSVLPDDSLCAKFHGYNILLKHTRYNIFKPSNNSDFPFITGLRFKFEEDANGNINSVLVPFEPKVCDISFKKQKQANTFDEEYLQKFVGHYNYSGFDISIESGNKRLLAKTFGRSPFELIPTEINLFSVKGFDGHVVKFIYDGDNIQSINLVQPSGDIYTALKS